MNMINQWVRQLAAVGMLCLVCCSPVVSGQESAQTMPSYRLGPGDLIAIDVFGEDDLSLEVMLDNTGVISYPFLGEITVVGLTVGELKNVLVSGLKGPYLVSPDITVVVQQYRNIYVNGEVRNPGAYAYQPGMTVEKAVAMAGGYTERASRSKIELKGAGDAAANVVLVSSTDSISPGDIITVKQSFF